MRCKPRGLTRHLTGYAPTSIKSVEMVSFSDHSVVNVFLKMRCFFSFYPTLGVLCDTNVKTKSIVIQNAI